MAWWAQFGWGLVGSAGVEVVLIVAAYEGSHFPSHYRKKGWWFWRGVLAVAGGSLAIAYGIQNPLLAINIGAAAPALFRSFAQGLRQANGIGNT